MSWLGNTLVTSFGRNWNNPTFSPPHTHQRCVVSKEATEVPHTRGGCSSSVTTRRAPWVHPGLLSKTVVTGRTSDAVYQGLLRPCVVVRLLTMSRVWTVLHLHSGQLWFCLWASSGVITVLCLHGWPVKLDGSWWAARWVLLTQALLPDGCTWLSPHPDIPTYVPFTPILAFLLQLSPLSSWTWLFSADYVAKIRPKARPNSFPLT